MELKITGTKEKLTLQNKTHELVSETKKTFRTNKISALKEYLRAGSGDVSAYYDEQSIEVWGGDVNYVLSRNDIPIAQCDFTKTDELNILSSKINVELNENELCVFFRKMSRYSLGILDLKDSIENMQMKKIVSMSKSKDSAGNFSYEYSVKDHGKSMFTPPKKIKFTIPIFKHIDNKIPFELDFVFQYKMIGADENKKAQLTFRLEMLNLNQFIEQACEVIVEKEMESFDFPKYWGVLHKKTYTDEWKYKDVPLQFEGLPKG